MKNPEKLTYLKFLYAAHGKAPPDIDHDEEVAIEYGRQVGIDAVLLAIPDVETRERVQSQIEAAERMRGDVIGAKVFSIRGAMLRAEQLADLDARAAKCGIVHGADGVIPLPQ